LRTDFVPHSNGHEPEQPEQTVREPEQPEQGEQTAREHEQGEHHAEAVGDGFSTTKVIPMVFKACSATKRTLKIAF